MTATADKTDPALWDKVKKKVTKEGRGGKPGQWSARKAQLAVHDYKQEGGGYKGRKTEDNHLAQWTHEDWGTKSGGESLKTGERYLPRQARDELTPEEYRRTSAKKRADLHKGKQFSAQPRDVAEKTSHAHGHHAELAALPRAELLKRAQQHNVAGRSRMKKAELVRALFGQTVP